MPSNIELKARLNDITEALKVAQDLAKGESGKTLIQHDTFFGAKECRLKLRKEVEGCFLIAYNRIDSPDAKKSDYEKIFVEDHDKMKTVLKKALGVVGVVEKSRELFMTEYKGLTARIHIDIVWKLGNFIEFEVLLNSDEDQALGEEMIRFLKEKFSIKDEDLVSGAYLDSLGKVDLVLEGE